MAIPARCDSGEQRHGAHHCRQEARPCSTASSSAAPKHTQGIAESAPGLHRRQHATPINRRSSPQRLRDDRQAYRRPGAWCDRACRSDAARVISASVALRIAGTFDINPAQEGRAGSSACSGTNVIVAADDSQQAAGIAHRKRCYAAGDSAPPACLISGQRADNADGTTAISAASLVIRSGVAGRAGTLLLAVGGVSTLAIRDGVTLQRAALSGGDRCIPLRRRGRWCGSPMASSGWFPDTGTGASAYCGSAAANLGGAALAAGHEQNRGHADARRSRQSRSAAVRSSSTRAPIWPRAGVSAPGSKSSSPRRRISS